MRTLGSLPAPTPAGVPVMMTVPTGRVVPCDRKLTISAMLKMRSLTRKMIQHMPDKYDVLKYDLLCAAVLEQLSIPQPAYSKFGWVGDHRGGH